MIGQGGSVGLGLKDWKMFVRQYDAAILANNEASGN